jgi:hypothetical protein
VDALRGMLAVELVYNATCFPKSILAYPDLSSIPPAIMSSTQPFVYAHPQLHENYALRRDVPAEDSVHSSRSTSSSRSVHSTRGRNCEPRAADEYPNLRRRSLSPEYPPMNPFNAQKMEGGSFETDSICSEPPTYFF